MRIASIVGARPQFIKLAPLCRAIEQRNQSVGADIEHVIIHTGQHYDAKMSGAFFSDLRIPDPHFDLGIGSDSHSAQTGKMLAALGPLLEEVRPDAVVVFGDTNSTLAGALAAAKLKQRLVHIEAGLRSFQRGMPEEINRVVADHVCDLLFAPTATAMQNLADENLSERSVFVGDIMHDAVLQHRELSESRAVIRQELGLSPGEYGVVTIHRAQNTEVGDLRRLLDSLNIVATEMLPLVFPIHPRTAARWKQDLPDWRPAPGLRLHEPVGYFDMLWLLENAQLALTDSGGLQKEAFFLNCPCVTLRNETEWPETVEGQGNRLAGSDGAAVVRAVVDWQARLKARPADFSTSAGRLFGDGRSAERMVVEIVGAVASDAPLRC